MEENLTIILRCFELFVTSFTAVTLVIGLLKMFKSAREAKAERVITRAAAELAAAHAQAANAKADVLAENVLKIELATNSMKDDLVAPTERASGLAGEERGRRAEVQRRTTEGKPR